MKARLNFRKSALAIGLVAMAAVSFTACKKDKVDYPDVPAAGLMAYNLAPDQQSVVFGLNGNSITNTALAYTGFTGVYKPINPGSRIVDVYDYPASTPLSSVSKEFVQDEYYSVFFLGRAGQYKSVIALDDFDTLDETSGKAYVRYVNAITDSTMTPAVTINGGGASVVNDNAAYGAVSQFKQVAPGEVAIAVKNGATVDASRTITVEADKVYTVLLMGIPGATVDAEKVQIRFVTNGKLSADTNK